jgi:hypothetical protein
MTPHELSRGGLTRLSSILTNTTSPFVAPFSRIQPCSAHSSAAFLQS